MGSGTIEVADQHSLDHGHALDRGLRYADEAELRGHRRIRDRGLPEQLAPGPGPLGPIAGEHNAGWHDLRRRVAVPHAADELAVLLRVLEAEHLLGRLDVDVAVDGRRQAAGFIDREYDLVERLGDELQ